MKVLHLSSVYAPHAVGGAEKVVQILAERMAARGVHTGVAHLVPKPQAPSCINGVSVFPLRHRNPLWIEHSARYHASVRQANKLATLCNVLTARDFAAALDAQAPDILHTHSMMELTPWMWRAARRRRIAIVHTLHDFDLLCIRGALFRNGRRCLRQHLGCRLVSAVKQHHHGCIDHVVGVSRSILDIHLERELFASLPPQRRGVVWNPVAMPLQPARHRPRGARVVFGFLGRLVAEKGILVLLEACRLLQQSAALPGGWHVSIAGRTPDGSVLPALPDNLPIDMRGYVDSAAFLASIDVLVAPAIWSEPFGLTVMEALAAGIPVIGSDLGGVAEIIRRVEPAWLVPPGDATALADGMARIGGAIAAGADIMPDVSDILALVDADHVASRYLAIYDGLLRAASARATQPDVSSAAAIARRGN